MGLVTQIYRDVQIYLTQKFAEGKPPTTFEIQRHVFTNDFNPDSRKQRDAVYFCIQHGRVDAIQALQDYWESQESDTDNAEAEYYSDFIEEQSKKPSYGKFYADACQGKFGEISNSIKNNMDAHCLIAHNFEKKLQEFSKNGLNFVIADYGKDSRWRIPEYWEWGIRERALYIRSLRILEKQLTRGIETKMLLPTGKSLDKALGYAGSTRALIEDGTSWTCICGMENLSAANFCSNCGKAKPVV